MDMQQIPRPQEESDYDHEARTDKDLGALLESAVTEGIIDESQYETLTVARVLIEGMIDEGLIPLIADTKENRDKYGKDLNPVINPQLDFILTAFAVSAASSWLNRFINYAINLQIPTSANSPEEIALVFATHLPIIFLVAVAFGIERNRNPDYKKIRHEFFSELKNNYREFMRLHDVDLEGYPTPLLTNLVDTEDGTSSTVLTFEVSDEIDVNHVSQLLLSLRSYQQMFEGFTDKMVVIIPHSLYHELYSLDITTVLREGTGRKRKTAAREIEPYKVPQNERYKSEVVDLIHPNSNKSALLIDTGKEFDRILVEVFGRPTISRTASDWILQNKVLDIGDSTVINGLLGKYSDLVPNRLLDFDAWWSDTFRFIFMISMFVPVGYPFYAWARRKHSHLKQTEIRSDLNLEA